jgi:hypothetical protein
MLLLLTQVGRQRLPAEIDKAWADYCQIYPLHSTADRDAEQWLSSAVLQA